MFQTASPGDRTTSRSAQCVAELPQPNSRALAAQGGAVATTLWGLNIPASAGVPKRFYDVVGKDIATELVDWFNAVDATYRADLRELNELNFARFDAKLEQRLATLDAAWQGRWTELDAKLEQRLAELDAKWGGRWTQLDAKLEQRLAELRVELVKELAGVKSGLKWMLAFWAPTALAVIGTGAGVLSQSRPAP